LLEWIVRLVRSQKIPIPLEFQSFLLEGPFEKCVSCDTKLLGGGQIYEIQKAYRGEETIWEYAMCLHCILRFAKTLSEESVARVRQHLWSDVDSESRRRELLAVSPDAVDAWLAECIVSGRRRSECDEYQISGAATGDLLALDDSPYMISGVVMEGLAGKLSKKTKERLGDFVDEYLGLPPEFNELMKDRPLVLL
jgi:hypothetical protein